jgi:hypothetical protein
MKDKLIVIVALLLALAIPSFAATTGTIPLSGSVAAICSLGVDTAAVASNLAITTKVTGVTIATITEKSNAANGYTVTLTTTNGWKLLSSAGSLSYSLTYGGATVDTTSSTVAGATATITSTDAGVVTPSAGTAKVLAISFDGASALLPAGDYTDSLTITIASR